MSEKSLKKKRPQKHELKTKWGPILVLIITVFLYYGNTLKNGYSLDDDLVTTTDLSKHERVEKGISGIPEIFRTHYVTNNKQQYEYRPVVTSSFAIEHQFFGHKTNEERASISHFISVFLYALIIVLIYLLILKLYPDKTWVFPFLVALLFLIHPIHSEVINNIKCRDELFVMIFGLLAIFALLRYVDSGYEKITYLIIGIAAVLLSILSKRVGITFVVLIPLILYYFRDIKLKKIFVLFGLLFIGIIVFNLLKNTAIGESTLREKMFFENPLYFSESLLERIPMFFYSIIFYVKMMLLPIPLVYYYGYDQIEIVGWSNPFVWVGVLFVLGGVFFAIKRIRKKEMWAFGFFFFMFGIGGAANLLFPAVGIVAERFVFTGSFGLVFIAVYYGFQLYEKHKQGKNKFAFYSVSVAIVILSFSQVTSRNKDWNSRFSLYKNDISNLPKSAKAHSLLATEYTSKADLISRTPNSSYSSYMNNIDSAIMEFKTCLDIYDGYYNSANNAGALYFTRKKDHYKAKPLFLEAIKYKPNYVEALFNYGNCLENDFKSIKELQLNFNEIRPDSLLIKTNELSTNSYGQELKAAFSIYTIKNEIRQVLSKVNLNQPNWKEVTLYQVMLSFDMNLGVENGMLKNQLNTTVYKQTLLRYFNAINQTNAQVQLQQAMTYSENFLKEVLHKELIVKNQDDTTYFQTSYSDLSILKNNIYDSVESYWLKALEADKTYYYCYKALTSLYINEKQLEKVIEISNRAITEGEYGDNTEFYLNIGNVYNSRLEYSKAILNMEEGISEIDKIYAKVYNNSNLNETKKRATLSDLLNRKKQILGFIANIYFNSGDQVNGVKYQKLSEEL